MTRRELTSVTEVLALTDDPLLLWGTQDFRVGVRAWSQGASVVVAIRGLMVHDRFVVGGEPTDVVPLLRHAIDEVGPRFRVMGWRKLVDDVVPAMPELVRQDTWGWMDTTRPTGVAGGKWSWLDSADEPEIGELLRIASPGSYAQPGLPGVARWAGVRDDAGRLASVVAEAWSGGGAGFLAGVATAPDARGRGLATALCAAVIDELLPRYGRVALMTDDWNHTAIRMYERLGLRWRTLAGATVGPGDNH